MSVYSKRTIVVLEPEFASALEQLQRERFPQGSRTAMLRYLIARGLDAASRADRGKEEK